MKKYVSLLVAMSSALMLHAPKFTTCLVPSVLDNSNNSI